MYLPAVLLLSGVLHAVSQPTVTLDGCTFHGKEGERGVAQFLSVPYAAPPVGELRWAEGRRITSYQKVCTRFNATYHRTRCYQLQFAPETKPWPPQSEDCLHLSVYTPSTTGRRKVMVYYHGGSSVSGGNFQYDFTHLAAVHNVVVVVPNYRLALLGFLAFKELSTTSPTHVSGNYGLMDCKAALQWLKQYIGYFGGDAQDVTVFGQSTGGTVVLSMLASPSMRGLVSRGISLSGSPNISMALPAAEQQGAGIVKHLGCDRDRAEDVVECMRNIPPENITAAYPAAWGVADNRNFGIPGPDRTGFHEAGLMIVDGYLVTHSVFDALREGVHPFPLMLGNTQYEGDFSPPVDVSNYTTRAEFAAYLNSNFAQWGPTFGQRLWEEHYTFEYSVGGAPLVYYGLGADSTGFCGSRYLAKLAADSEAFSAGVYVFSMAQWPSHPFPQSPDWKCKYAFHAIDLFASTFTWNSFAYWGSLPFVPQESDNDFGAAVRRHWKSFQDHNAPQHPWVEFSKENGYPVAITGNGTHSASLANRTLSVPHYKDRVCATFEENGIGPNFWWSN
eukprot:Sspe_Gene.61814::Locus_34419_Transcript_1_2_Confidence_0.600_Length_2165::g.61814::m.61814